MTGQRVRRVVWLVKCSLCNCGDLSVIPRPYINHPPIPHQKHACWHMLLIPLRERGRGCVGKEGERASKRCFSGASCLASLIHLVCSRLGTDHVSNNKVDGSRGTDMSEVDFCPLHTCKLQTHTHIILKRATVRQMYMFY